MANTKDLDLDSIGIKGGKAIYHNLSYEEFFQQEIDPALSGYEKGFVTEFGAVAVDTGKFTGRSPKDKYIVEDNISQPTVWWADGSARGSDNKKLSLDGWDHLKGIAVEQLSGKNLYCMDGFCGANKDTRVRVRLLTEVAWMAHFFKNMFIRPSEDELNDFKPDWTILNACKATCQDFAKYKMNSEVFVAFNLTERMTIIGGTWYAGEIKKGIFSIMNYFLPLKGIGSFHCSANMGMAGDTALFFGLSGTGKTTLSADPKRQLIGDDEHGWDQDGVFNFEGGCYAKCINLSAENEPDIYHAIKRNALLENVDYDAKSGQVNFGSGRKTENTRVAYPIDHIKNIVKPVSKGGHPARIIFLTCDAYGVLPPVSKLTKEQAMYHYLSGYTAKVAGTELGVTEPKATFSACFGQAFLLLHPTSYAHILGKKMDEHGAKAYLVDTGWIGGKYGVGHRIQIKETRAIIDAIIDGSLDQQQCVTMPIFNLQVPQFVKGVSSQILNPRDSWEKRDDYDATARKLAKMFIDNFQHYTDTEEGKALEAAGPRL